MYFKFYFLYLVLISQALKYEEYFYVKLSIAKPRRSLSASVKGDYKKVAA